MFAGVLEYMKEYVGDQDQFRFQKDKQYTAKRGKSIDFSSFRW
jgi:hypothetical protein